VKPGGRRRPDRVDDPDDLVARHDWRFRERKIPFYNMQVRAADSACADADSNLARPGPAAAISVMTSGARSKGASALSNIARTSRFSSGSCGGLTLSLAREHVKRGVHPRRRQTFRAIGARLSALEAGEYFGCVSFVFALARVALASLARVVS
jgi:hypothetical protein